MSIVHMSLKEMSMAAGILIIGIVLFRLLFVRRIPKRIMVILWGIVVLRLLLPFCIAPFPSIITLVMENIPPGDSVFGAVTVTAANFEAGNVERMFYTVELSQGVDWSMILTTLYLAGAAVMCIGSVYLYLRDSRLFRESLPMEKQEKELLLRQVGEVNTKRKHLKKIDFRISDRTATPITYGVFRPAIVFPKGIWLKEEKEVTFCLLHELVHIRNHDNLKKMIVHLALCIHWFNPLVWVMYVLFNRDVELLCDETAVRRGMADRQDYALALLSLAERRTDGFRTVLGFGKNAVKERILSVMTAGETKISGVLAGVFTVAVSLGAFLGSQAVAVSAASAEYVVVTDEIATASYENSAAEQSVDAVTLASAEAEMSQVQTVMEEAELPDGMIASLQKLAGEFEVFGLQVQITSDDYQLYFDDKPVYFFADNQNLDGNGFSGRVYAREAGNGNGDTGVVTERDEDGAIIGLVRLSEEESRDVAMAWTGRGR